MKKMFALAAAAGALTLSVTASAQNNNNQFFTGRVGAFVPLDGNLRNVSNWFLGAGIDYTFSTAYIHGGETFLSLDGLFKTNGGGHLNIFPICINERFYLNNDTGSRMTAGRAQRTYAFVGVGGFLFDSSPSTWRFGGRGGLGVELGNNMVAEAAIYLSAPTSGVAIRANAIGAYIGYHF